ncbi:MAG: CAP domain-containing protein [Reyranellales bacterium]
MGSVLLTTMIALLNAARLAAHVPALTEDPALQGRAQARAETLCARGQFSHDGFPAAFAGLAYKWRGENLAKGQRDAASTHAALMASPGHRANILKREFGAVGVGHACDITVELFGGK